MAGHLGSAHTQFLTPRTGTGAGRFAVTDSGSAGEQRINARSALPAGTWTHVAVTQTGNLGVFYVNGVEVARNANLTLHPSDLGSTIQNWLGRSQYSWDPYLDGQLDDVRIYGRALTPAEISSLHSGGQ